MAKKKKKKSAKAKPKTVLHTRTRSHPTQALGPGAYGVHKGATTSDKKPISR